MEWSGERVVDMVDNLVESVLKESAAENSGTRSAEVCGVLVMVVLEACSRINIIRKEGR